MFLFSGDVWRRASVLVRQRISRQESHASTSRWKNFLGSATSSMITSSMKCDTSFFDPVTTEDAKSEIAISEREFKFAVAITRRAPTLYELDDEIVCAPGNGGSPCVASWGWSRSQGLGCSPIKAARELGLERRSLRPHEVIRGCPPAHIGETLMSLRTAT